jgi:hypothetical protein
MKMARKHTARLAVVAMPTDGARPEPPRPLGEHGMKLWTSIVRDYEFSDPGSIETLCEACQALDRAEELAAQIATDGVIVRGRAGPRDHPALKHELANRAFVTRSLARLGLDLEPLHDRPGRPGGSGF